MRFVRPYAATGLLGLAAAAFVLPQAIAQQVFRIVGPDGRVTFSDKPPLDASAKVAPALSLGSGGGTGPALPFELRQAVSKYPVMFYSSSNCGPCGAGRAYLTSRGIPFTEKTIVTAEDAEALQRIAGESLVPLLTVGGQQIRGYSDSEWGQFLDAAGYPARSVLPGSYRNPAPAPLVAVQRATPAAAQARTPVSAPAQANQPQGAAAESGPNTSNPAGIRF